MPQNLEEKLRNFVADESLAKAILEHIEDAVEERVEQSVQRHVEQYLSVELPAQMNRIWFIVRPGVRLVGAAFAALITVIGVFGVGVVTDLTAAARSQSQNIEAFVENTYDLRTQLEVIKNDVGNLKEHVFRRERKQANE